MTNHLRPIRIANRTDAGHTLWRIRHLLGISPAGLARRLGITRSGVYRREAHGHFPAAALIDHANALGYDVVLVPRTHTSRRAA